MQTGNEYRNSKIALVQENMYHFMIHKRKQTQPQESNIIYILSFHSFLLLHKGSKKKCLGAITV